MTCLALASTPSRPRWDGSRVLFEISDGAETVLCAISRAALEDLGDVRCAKTADLLRCFEAARERIERLALDKFRGRIGGATGRLSLWADDVGDPPLGGAAASACRDAPHLAM